MEENMTSKPMMKCTVHIRKITFIACSIGLYLLTNAAITLSAPIPIDYLSVNQVSITATASSIPAPIESDLSYSPPKIISMGQYSSPPPSTTSDIFFTGDDGAPPPSGTVDGAINSIDVDLSSLWVHVYYNNNPLYISDSIPLWDNTLVIQTNSYNPDDNSFVLEWTGNTEADVYYLSTNAISVPVNYNIALQGTVSTVPIQGAIWLFASGLFGIVGIGKRYKQK
jgi:hypothetical protein